MFVVNVEKKASFMVRLCAIHAISDSMMVRADKETASVFAWKYNFPLALNSE